MGLVTLRISDNFIVAVKDKNISSPINDEISDKWCANGCSENACMDQVSEKGFHS